MRTSAAVSLPEIVDGEAMVSTLEESSHVALPALVGALLAMLAALWPNIPPPAWY